jgi:hypothetical protein
MFYTTRFDLSNFLRHIRGKRTVDIDCKHVAARRRFETVCNNECIVRSWILSSSINILYVVFLVVRLSSMFYIWEGQWQETCSNLVGGCITRTLNVDVRCVEVESLVRSRQVFVDIRRRSTLIRSMSWVSSMNDSKCHCRSMWNQSREVLPYFLVGQRQRERRRKKREQQQESMTSHRWKSCASVDVRFLLWYRTCLNGRI